MHSNTQTITSVVMPTRAKQTPSATRRLVQILLIVTISVALLGSLVDAGGKGGKGKGKGEDIILYNGNIVMRGQKGEGNFVLANNHPVHEHAEMDESFMSHWPGLMKGFGGMGMHQ